MTRRGVAVVVALAIAGTRDVRADAAEAPIDPEARRVGEEANLETTERRRGFVGGAFLGPSFTIGGGTGTGGTVSLRLGQVATPRTVIAFQLDGSGQLRKVSTGPGTSEIRTNSIGSFLVGMQHWIGPSLSVRLLGGVGVYTCAKCRSDLTDERRPGVAGGAGVGVDLVRFARGIVLALDVTSINQINRDGLVSTNTFGLGLSFD